MLWVLRVWVIRVLERQNEGLSSGRVSEDGIDSRGRHVFLAIRVVSLHLITRSRPRAGREGDKRGQWTGEWRPCISGTFSWPEMGHQSQGPRKTFHLFPGQCDVPVGFVLQCWSSTTLIWRFFLTAHQDGHVSLLHLPSPSSMWTWLIKKSNELGVMYASGYLLGLSPRFLGHGLLQLWKEGTGLKNAYF